MAEIIYNGWDRYNYDAGMKSKFYENKRGDVYYRELKCKICEVNHLVKITRDTENDFSVLMAEEPVSESLVMKIFLCVRCGGTRWPVTDKMEVVDVY